MHRVAGRLLGVILLLTLAVPAGLLPARPASAAPADGALIGLWPDQNLSTLDTADQSTVEVLTPGAYTQPSNLSYIPAMNAWQGKPNSIIQFYDSVDSNAFSSWTPLIWDDYHAIPMMTMNTGGSSPNTNAQVAAGADDSQLSGYATALKSWITGPDVRGVAAPAGGRRLFIRMDWEGNGNWYTWAPTNTATDCTNLLQLEQDYAAMWRHVHDLVMGVGLTSAQVSWVFSVNSADAVPTTLQGCANGASDVTKNIFPGDAYVDWTGIDAYGFCSAQSPTQILAPMVSELRSISTRPLSTNEVGASTAGLVGSCGTVANKGRWIAAYLDYLRAEDIKMAIWFNANIYETSRPTDWAVFSQPGPHDVASAGDCTYPSSPATTYNTYCEYPQGLAAPFYATLDPTNTRVVSDAEFEGTWTAAGGSVPAAPTLSATSERSQVTLAWNKPSDGGAAITGYQVLRGTASGSETLLTTLDAWNRSYTDTAVAAGTTYYYEVKAVNAVGTGTASNEASSVPQAGGALVGVWPDQNISVASGESGQYSQPNQFSYIPAMNAWQGKPNSVINVTTTLDPNAYYDSIPMIWDQYHAIPMVSLDSSNGSNTNAQVAAGAGDSNLYMYGVALQTWLNGTDALGNVPPAGGRRVYLRLNSEGNANPANKWSVFNTATDCTSLLQAEHDYVAAWRHAHDVISLVGLPSNQVSWVFSVDQADQVPTAMQGCANGASDVTRNIYPGDAYVDWVGVDGLSYCSASSASSTFGAMVTELKSLTTRPISIDQVGASSAQLTGTCTTTTPAQKGQWIAGYLSYLQTAGIKMSVWFNADEYTTSPVDYAVFSQANLPQDFASRGDCTYSTNAAITYNAYCEYAQGLAGAYFTGGDPADPRVIGDAEFEGAWSVPVTAQSPRSHRPAPHPKSN